MPCHEITQESSSTITLRGITCPSCLNNKKKNSEKGYSEGGVQCDVSPRTALCPSQYHQGLPGHGEKLPQARGGRQGASDGRLHAAPGPPGEAHRNQGASAPGPQHQARVRV